MKNKTKVLVIDDEPQIRKLLRITLEVNDYVCLDAETAKQGIHLAASNLPDIILLDLNLPDDDGLSVLKQIREWSKAQIIILSVRSSESDKIKLLDSGADDYITKPFHTGELLSRIRVALRHQDFTQDIPIQTIGDIEINFASRTVKKSGNIVNLTYTEYAIVSYLYQIKTKLLHTNKSLKIFGEIHFLMRFNT